MSKERIRQAGLRYRCNGIHSGLFEQGSSDYPERSRFLASLWMNSISLNPDTRVTTTLRVLHFEKRREV